MLSIDTETVVPADGDRVRAFPGPVMDDFARRLEEIVLDRTAPPGLRRFRPHGTLTRDEDLMVRCLRSALLNALAELCMDEPDRAIDLLGADILEGSWHWLWAAIFALAIRRRHEIANGDPDEAVDMDDLGEIVSIH